MKEIAAKSTLKSLIKFDSKFKFLTEYIFCLKLSINERKTEETLLLLRAEIFVGNYISMLNALKEIFIVVDSD